jgi:hypothetical protein
LNVGAEFRIMIFSGQFHPVLARLGPTILSPEDPLPDSSNLKSCWLTATKDSTDEEIRSLLDQGVAKVVVDATPVSGLPASRVALKIKVNNGSLSSS